MSTQNTQTPNRSQQRISPRDWLGTVLVASLASAGAWGVAWLVNRSLRRVTGPSMLPWLGPGDLLLTVPTTVRQPRRGDLVIVEVAGTPAVKRLVGLPSERVVLVDGHLHVDGSWWDLPGAVLVDEDRVWDLGDGEVVVLGDNREASTDSRTVDPIRHDAITRLVVASVRPPRRVGPEFGMRRLKGSRTRAAVRVVTLDPDDRVLLFRVADVDGVLADWWETPGGGLQPGEDVMAAAHRELAEEIGATDCEVVALGHVATRDSSLWGAPLRRVESTVATRVATAEVDDSGWTIGERRDIVEWRWFTLPELAAVAAVTVPANLVDLITHARTMV